METEHIGRLARMSVAAGLLAAFIPFLFGAMDWAAGVAAGAIWGAANLVVLRFLIVRLLRPSDERRRQRQLGGVVLGLVIKIPLLYGMGYCLLRSSLFRVEGLGIGFTVLLAVAFADALRRVLADQRAAGLTPSARPSTPTRSSAESSS